MLRRLDPIVLRRRPPVAAGLLAMVLTVGLATAAVAVLRHHAPVVSLSVVYLLAVLAISTYWGIALGILTSLLSALTYNFCFLPPTGRLTIADSRNWVALAAFFVVALVTSTMAEAVRARATEAEQRRREADLGAELARTLLGGPRVAEALPAVSRRVAELLVVRSVTVELGAVDSDARHTAIPLMDGDVRIGSLVLPADLPPGQEARVRRRVVPGLESVVAAALARERLDATRLSALIDQLLDLARIQAGTAAPNRTWCSIDEALRDAAEQVAPDGGPFRFSIDVNLPLVRADGVQLERAFANLLENAVRYGNGQPVSVRARAVGRRLIVRIVDRGPGIPRHEQERIFTAFYRAPATTAMAMGSGLGLAIAKGFIEGNGGGLSVESLPGQGATFVIELPIEPVDDAAPDPSGDVPARA
jgi:two-component system sensor histidine kinase KdpD